VRPFTFFEKGVVGHVGFADPFDERIAKVWQKISRKQ
jgi:5'-methylthioadenosine phosphorylase